MRVLWGLWYLFVGLLTIAAFVDGHPVQGAVYLVVLVGMGLLQHSRRPSRQQALARSAERPASGAWTADRVEAVLAGVADDLPSQVRALRVADPGLSLAEASALLRGRHT